MTMKLLARNIIRIIIVTFAFFFNSIIRSLIMWNSWYGVTRPS